VINLDN